MRLVKDNSAGGRAVRVLCKGAHHAEVGKYGPMFTLAEGYADLDGKPFEDYYCDECVADGRYIEENKS